MTKPPKAAHLQLKQEVKDGPIFLMKPWPELTTILEHHVDQNLIVRQGDTFTIMPTNGMAEYKLTSDDVYPVAVELQPGSVYDPPPETFGVSGKSPFPPAPIAPAAIVLDPKPVQDEQRDTPERVLLAQAAMAAEMQQPVTELQGVMRADTMRDLTKADDLTPEEVRRIEAVFAIAKDQEAEAVAGAMRDAALIGMGGILGGQRVELTETAPASMTTPEVPVANLQDVIADLEAEGLLDPAETEEARITRLGDGPIPDDQGLAELEDADLLMMAGLRNLEAPTSRYHAMQVLGNARDGVTERGVIEKTAA